MNLLTGVLGGKRKGLGENIPQVRCPDFSEQSEDARERQRNEVKRNLAERTGFEPVVEF